MSHTVNCTKYEFDILYTARPFKAISISTFLNATLKSFKTKQFSDVAYVFCVNNNNIMIVIFCRPTMNWKLFTVAMVTFKRELYFSWLWFSRLFNLEIYGFKNIIRKICWNTFVTKKNNNWWFEPLSVYCVFTAVQKCSDTQSSQP